MAVSQLVTAIATVIPEHVVHLPYTSRSDDVVNDTEWNEDSIGGGKKRNRSFVFAAGQKKKKRQ